MGGKQERLIISELKHFIIQQSSPISFRFAGRIWVLHAPVNGSIVYPLHLLPACRRHVGLSMRFDVKLIRDYTIINAEVFVRVL
jgi:hypothetical protein